MGDSPTSTMAENWRMMIGLPVENGWVPSLLDVKMVFCQRRGYDKKVVLEPPM